MILLALAACSGEEKKKDGPADAAAAPETASPASPDAALPVDVAGAYLVGCSSATGPTYVSDSTVSASLTACVVRDKEGKEVVLAAPSVTVTTAAATVSPTLIAKETIHAWSIGFTTPPEVLATLREIKIEFKTADGKTVVAATDNAAFDWSKDPAFIGAMEFLTTLHEFASPAKPYDGRGELATLRANGVPYHLLFVTDTVFQGGFGEAAADAHCDTAGQAIDADARYVALLSTTTRAAKDKIPLSGTVYNFNGAGIAVADVFWNYEWFTTVLSETGLDINRRTVKASPPFFMLDAWTGTSKGGVLATDGATCADWTASDAVTKGHAWQPLDEGPGTPYLTRNATYACSRPARLACISLWPRGRP